MLGVDILMIFVTLGTQDKPFKRILDLIEQSKTDEKIVVQNGYTEFKSNKMDLKAYFSPEELQKCLMESDIIVTHGGVGSIMQGLKLKKKIIALPRLSRYGEHQNDHQQEIVNAYEKRGYILKWNENESFDEILKRAESFEPKPFESNHERFVSQLVSYIEENV